MIENSLGTYNIISRLSVGGMGEVYLAKDTRLHRKVALKVLPQEWGSDPERLERFQWEARVLATLNHPNIVTIYSVEQEDGVHFFTMELVEGQTLWESIPQDGLPLDRFLELAIPLADALAAAHQRGIIHRDIKPGNIMVRPDNRLKMLDFGLAKREVNTADSQAETKTAGLRGPEPQTQDGRLLGTVAYMSPEQVAGKPIDHRADLFALGIVFYEMLTGVRPFEHPDWATKILSHLLEKQPPPAPPDAQLPQRLEEVVHRCLDRDPAMRYQTAVELRQDLTEMQMETVSGSFSSTQIVRPDFGRPKRVWAAALIGALIVFAVAAGFMVPRFLNDPEPVIQTLVEQQKIAVLPFQNLGSPDEADFAAGITEEIISRLASVSVLTVVRSPFDPSTPPEQVGTDLGVNYLLEGSVLWSSDGDLRRVRVIPKLMQISDGALLWSERYDRVLDDILEVQSDIAEQVIRQLNIRLPGSEQEILSASHTRNPEAYEAYLRGMARNTEAYEAYLRGKAYASRYEPSAKNWMLAVDMLTRAVRLDEEFAPAHAELSRVHSFIYHQSIDRTEDRLTDARRSAERALEIAPDLPDGHRALGYYYYWGRGDYERALEEFHTAVRLRPSDPRLHEGIGYIRRRQGRFEEALASFQKALELNPESNWLATEMAHTYTNLRRFEQADEHYDLAISIAPDQPNPYQLKSLNQLRWDGDIAKAREILAHMPGRSDTGSLYTRYKVELIARNYQQALIFLSGIKSDLVGVDSALFPKEMSRGGTYDILGDDDQARIHYENARRTLEKKIADRPEDPRLYSSLGLTYAGLTHVGLDYKAEAVRAGKKAIELYPMGRDAFVGPDFLVNLAVIHAWCGESDEALDLIEDILKMPAGLSVSLLRVHPRWDPLREHPRFQQLIGD